MPWARLAAVGVLGVTCIMGCLPEDMPVYVNDGKTIVLTTRNRDDGNSGLWVYDVQKNTAKPAQGGPVDFAKALGDQVWVQLRKSCKRYDPLKDEFLPGPAELEGREWLREAIPASYDGGRCILVPVQTTEEKPGQKTAYDVFSFPDMKKKQSLQLDDLLPAGGFWWIQVQPGKEKGRFYEGIDLFNPAGKHVCCIPPDQTAKVVSDYPPNWWGLTIVIKGQEPKPVGPEYPYPPAYARVSDDGTVLLLAFGRIRKGRFVFGVFDTKSGELLWRGKTNSNWGAPLVKRNEIWTFSQWPPPPKTTNPSSAETQPAWDHLALLRLSPDDRPVIERFKQEAVLVLPFRGNFSDDWFSPSPDGSHFVMVRNGSPPRLLFIPIKEGATDKDVRAVELEAAK